MAPITEGMTEPTCAKCRHPASQHRHAGSGAFCCSWESGRYVECAAACSIVDTDIYRHALAEAQADSAKAQRERDEMLGVIETYGRVELLTLEDRDELELRYLVSGLVLRAGGMDVFGNAIRECADRWRDKLHALRRAGMSTTEKMFEALADSERAARNRTPEPASRQPDPAPGVQK